LSSSSHKRRKVNLEHDAKATSLCPPPCGKVRYLSRALAKRAAARIHPDQKMRVYSGDVSSHECCGGFWHITSETVAGRTAFYRDREAFSRDHDLPSGWRVAVFKEAGRWRYVIYVPGEDPMPSTYTYASSEIAECEAVADIKGEVRSV